MVKKMVKPEDIKALDLNTFQPRSDFVDRGIHLDAKAICVVLDEDTKKSDLDAVMTAIAQLKGVAVVKFVDLSAFHDYSNRTRAKIEIRKKIGKILEV